MSCTRGCDSSVEARELGMTYVWGSLFPEKFENVDVYLRMRIEGGDFSSIY